jgi:hypothetical protein
MPGGLNTQKSKLPGWSTDVAPYPAQGFPSALDRKHVKKADRKITGRKIVQKGSK